MKNLVFALTLGALASTASANVITKVVEIDASKPTPVQLNFASPISVMWGERDVWGLKMNVFYGRSLDVYGLDAGLVSFDKGDFCGLAANVANAVDFDGAGIQVGALSSWCGRNFYGLQCSGLVNWNSGEAWGLQAAPFNVNGGVYGLELGALNWNTDDCAAYQFGAANVTRADFAGASFGGINYVKGEFGGLQLGVFNMIYGTSRGVQLGLFNAAEHHTGVQIGLLNINALGAVWIMPIVNVSFN